MRVLNFLEDWGIRMADSGNNVVDLTALMKSFDPNTPNENETVPTVKALLPTLGSTIGADQETVTTAMGIDAYMRAFQGEGGEASILEQVIRANDATLRKDFAEIVKAIDIPANMMSFARMSYMPDATNSGILQWPGVHPEALRKIVRENIAPNLIIGMRCDDMVRYSQVSNHPWKPGWRIEVFQGEKHPTSDDKSKIKEAENFLCNSSMKFDYNEALERDNENLTDFQRFLIAGTRDSLTFDGLAINTERDGSGRVIQYGLLPAGNIRLVGPAGYLANPDAYAVAVNEGGVVQRAYSREELIWTTRNVRVDPEYAVSLTRGYGYPEIDQSLRLIQGFQNVIDYNCDIFQKSGIPHGILLLTGNGWLQKQVDVLMRMWRNLKAGITKALALPVLAAPQNADVKVIDFSRIKGDEALYQDMLNLMIGAFCAVYRFPVHRIGYRISGKGPDTKQDPLGQAAMVDNDDVGLISLLSFWSKVINENFIWPRWPNLRFVFTGMNPKEDAREYEFKKNAMTWKEARAEADLPELTKVVSKDLKELAELMEMAPIDPNLSGVFQSIAAAFIKGEAREGVGLEAESLGSTMQSKKDPARSETHGHTSGVRRNSASEARSSSNGKA